MSSFASALVGSVGPLTATFFVSFGLVKGAYVGTEALCAVVTHLFKLAAYGGTAQVNGPSLLVGSLLGSVMVAGSLVGKRLMDRISPDMFCRLVQVTLVVAGVRLMLRG